MVKRELKKMGWLFEIFLVCYVNERDACAGGEIYISPASNDAFIAEILKLKSTIPITA